MKANSLSGALERLFDAGAKLPLLSLAVLLALQVVFLLDARALWYSDEIRYADVFEHLLRQGNWLVLHLNGEFYPDKPPVYFWFLRLLYEGVGEASPRLFFLGSALSGFFFIAATYALARHLGADRREGFAAGLALLAGFYFVGLCHYSRMDLFFASLIILAAVCLRKALMRTRAPGWMVCGFALAALATLTKGPLGLAFPLLWSVVFLLWKGDIRRVWSRDAALGGAVAAAILLAWLAGAWLLEGGVYLHEIFSDQIYRRATDTWHHGQPFYHYLLTLPGAWLPWTLVLAVLPWKKVATREFWRGVWSSRREGRGGHYLWIMFLTGFVLLSVVSIKIVIYLLPLFAPLAVLTARVLLGLDETRSSRLFFLVAVLFGVLAVGLPFANLFHPWPVSVQGLLPCAVVAAVVAVLLWKGVSRRAPASCLLLAAFGLTLWLQPLGLLTAPSLDAVMSPKAQGEEMRRYIGDGYYPMALKVYPGTYTYYAGQNIQEVKEYAELESVLAERPRVAVGMPKKYWERWENRPEGLRIVHEQWIVDRPYVLALWGKPLLEEKAGVARKLEQEPEQVKKPEQVREPGGSRSGAGGGF